MIQIVNVKPHPPKHVYTLVLRLKFMHGDADGESIREVAFDPKDHDSILKAKKFLYFVDQQPDYYRPGSGWAGPPLPDEFAAWKDDWPYDNPDSDDRAAFDGAEWIYYDVNGTPCSCEVIST